MNNSKPVALILGATGKTGSHLVHLLEQDGGSNHLEIRVAVRKPEQAETFRKRGIPTVHLDLDDLSTYEGALQGVMKNRQGDYLRGWVLYSRLHLNRPQCRDVPAERLYPPERFYMNLNFGNVVHFFENRCNVRQPISW